MGRRGPSKQPLEFSIARGNPGKRAINRDAPVFPPASSDAPPTLTGEALAEWNRSAPLLTSLGLLTEPSLVVFETYCRIVADVRAYEQLIETLRTTAPNGIGDAHKLGYASHLMKLRTLMKQYAGEMGLTPATRGNVKVPTTTPAKSDKKSRFLGKGA